VSYFYFHLVFILPAILATFHARRFEPGANLPCTGWGVATLAAIALIYTTPWDNYLVASGIWTYGPNRVAESLLIGYVPVEEYMFFILQPIMTGSFFLLFAGRQPGSVQEMQESLKHGTPSLLGSAFWVLLTFLGLACYFILPERFTYFGLILSWACPVLAFQWTYGGGTLWNCRRLLWASVQAPTLYLWVVDGIAIEWRIWEITANTSTQWKLFSLPLEEALFFLLTNLLVVQGLILFFQWIYARRRTAEAFSE
jgi:lycopene cyclase domain-containing protein